MKIIFYCCCILTLNTHLVSFLYPVFEKIKIVIHIWYSTKSDKYSEYMFGSSIFINNFFFTKHISYNCD